MKLISTVFLGVGLLLLSVPLQAQEALPLAEEGSPEAQRLQEAHEADLQGAMESPEEAARHQQALDRERGRTTAPAPAPAPAPTAAPYSPGPSAQVGAHETDLAIDSEPAYLREGRPRPVAAAKPRVSVELNQERTRIEAPPMRFGPWVTDLTDQHRAILDEVAGLMKSNTEDIPKVRVESYSDNSGDPAINEALTIARANVVKAYLIYKGVGVHRLDAKGFGEAHAIASNETAAGRAKNRRVEFKIVK